jgi:hypothetical protein
MDRQDEERVGYKNPPKKSRFQPGQSGNPQGRPRQAQTVGFEIVAELRQKVTVRENGTEKKLSKSAALAKSLVSRALAGDMRAVGHLMRLLPAQFQAPQYIDPSVDKTALGQEEAEILERFVARRFAQMQGPGVDHAIQQLKSEGQENE